MENILGYKVPYTKVLNVFPHPNADRLDIAVVYGWQIVVSKNKYKIGDRAIYIPIDSILNSKLEDKLFPKESKIKLNKQRVRQIKIRSFYSQGMLIHPEEVNLYLTDNDLEKDLAEILDIKKYDPPEIINQDGRSKQLRNKPRENPLFHMYNGINNIKWFPELFKENEEVIIQEKLHGSNLRAAVLPNVADTIWKKVLKFFGKLPEFEFLYGSNRVQISRKSSYKGFFGEDIYGAAIKKFKIFDKIAPNETVYMELIGPGIQKNYNYGHKEHHIVLFDVKVFNKETGEQTWMNPEEVESYAIERGFDFVPILYRGIFNKDQAYALTLGPSVYCKEQKVREGVVVKSRYNYNDKTCSSNKKALKVISEAYLADQSNTDNH